MPNLKASIKDVRKTAKRRQDNLRVKSVVRKVTKELREAVSNKEDSKKLMELLKSSYKAIDKSVKKGVTHKNNAARKKSRLAKLVDSLKK